MTKRIESFELAIEALAEFDQVHWSHARGKETARHTADHLRIAIDEVSTDLLDVDRLHEELQRLRRFSGTLIEHALRLQRASGISAQSVFPVSEEEYSEFFRGAELARMQYMIGGRLMMFLGAKLFPLDSVFERWGHGEENEDQWQTIANTARDLAFVAAVFGGHTSKETYFLVDFWGRLDHLWEKFGHMSARTF